VRFLPADVVGVRKAAPSNPVPHCRALNRQAIGEPVMKPRLSLLLPLLVAACSPAPDTPPAPPAPAGTAAAQAMVGGTAVPEAERLSMYHWRLAQATDNHGQRIDALFVRADKPVQLDFTDGRIGVANTCNRMGGGYAIDSGRLVVTQMTHTMMACAGPLMELDGAVDTLLRGRPRVQLQAAGSDAPRLVLATDHGDTLVFTGLPTAETRHGGPGEIAFLEVDATEIPAQDASCSGIPTTHPGTPCLRVRERHYDAQGLRAGEPGPWQVWADTIEGYSHRPGVRNVLRVKRFPPGQAPAGAASAAYVLDMVVESETIRGPGDRE
jgi:heat shock protein HslJ